MAKTKKKNRTRPHHASNSTTVTPTDANATGSNPPASNPSPSPAPANNTSNAIKVAVVTGIFTILAAIIAAMIDPPAFTSFFLRTPIVPTITPVPYARIQSLSVIHEGGDTDTTNIGDKIFLPVGSSVLIKVNFVTNTEVDNIVFHWEFCHPEKNTKGQGAIEIPYKLSDDGKDCINIKMEKDGQFLHTASFFINAKSD